MKKLINCITVIIAFGLMTHFTYAQTQSYPTDEEIQKLMPEFYRQVEYWNEYKEPERQKKAKAFAATWVHGLAVASSLGKWPAWEETMNIYPSTTEGQVCIINYYGAEQAVSLSLGNVLNQRIYTGNHDVIFLEGNYAGAAWSRSQAGVNVYRLFAPAEVLTRAFWRDWPEGYRVME